MEPKKLARLKRKHPKFFRSNFGRRTRKRIKDNWRKPRGVDNKKREKLRYVGREPNIGHRQPRAIRGMHPSGMYETLVRNLKMVGQVEKGTAVRIAGAVGKRTRAQIAEAAAKRGLRVLN